MANIGKYIDRNSDIQAAGKVIKSVENIGDFLQNYSIQEAAVNIINLKSKKSQKNVETNDSLGFSQFLPKESLKDLLSPELRKSRFVAFKEKFSEDMYLKKAELGKALELQSKPREFTNENFIYGAKTNRVEKLYELVFPKKTVKDVDKEFLNWHDKYLISHKHYLPSERIQRNYIETYEPNAVFGISTRSDQTGQMVKKCLQHCDSTVVINKEYQKFQARTIGQLGKTINRFNLDLPTNHTLGRQSKNQNNYNVKLLIENGEPCTKNIEIIEALSHINNLRRLIFSRSDFHMNDLKILLNQYDENGNGYVKLDVIMNALRSLKIHANEQKIRMAILHLKMFKDENETSDMIDTEEFWKLLHIQYPMPRYVNVMPLNKSYTNEETTYRLLCSDRDKPVISPQKCQRLKTEPDRTTSGSLLAPDIPMRYGLCSRDFEVLRSKDELNVIFKNVLPHNFDQVWQFACMENDGESCGKMSLNEFRNYLDEYNKKLQ